MVAGNGHRAPYPAIEPHATGLLEVSGGHQLYWEECGNPDGKPVVYLHGGPGGGCLPYYRRLFDPEAYRIVLFDQRGCGRSTPNVADLDSAGARSALESITTWDLVDDIETLRAALGIDAWQVFGGSWGSTLALAYAQSHPERVTELVLRGIFLCRESEFDFFYRGQTGQLFPEGWEEFLAPLRAAGHDPEAEGFDHVAAYHRLLFDDDDQVALRAARAWTEWEKSTSTLLPPPGGESDHFALAFARIENHFFVNGAWLRESPILDRMDRIAHLPAVIVQGRYDVVCPAVSAWELHRAWPGSELRIVDDAGHSVSEAGITDRLLDATDRFR